ncbi:MAG: response regulator [Bdellovibrio sp.]|jgi:two-component system chemotaxis response regulator CheY
MFAPTTRILILDDMMTMRKIVVKALKDIGFTDVQDGIDGLQGWEILNSSTPPIELVISDWNMPNCTGFELLKRVRASENFAKLPFVLLTAESESHQVLSALQLDVTNYIIKPFTTQTLREKLEQAHKKVTEK